MTAFLNIVVFTLKNLFDLQKTFGIYFWLLSTSFANFVGRFSDKNINIDINTYTYNKLEI